MMTLANYGIGSSKHKDPNSAKVLSKSLQIRNRSELLLKQCLKSHHRITDEKRNEILNLIRDYYSRIPFNVVIWNKYQTKQCIIDSILLLDYKFNPYKAREAFKLVEKMLVNLVYLPWHNEFKKIHTYSGSYRLNISDPLIGIEEVLKAAGFQESKDCVMHLILPEDKMPQTDDGESVTSVLFDCMVAQVVLSDIIDIFENCCRSAKYSEENTNNINSYSWIQAYFRERSHQTTERACSSIQELLNNITNHLAKCDATTQHKTSNSNVLNHASLQSNDKTGISNLKSSDSRESPNTAAREKTIEFLAQQSREDENLLTLSSDLLRIPFSSEGIKKSGSNSKYDHEPSNVRSSIRPPYTESTHQQSALNNGYTNQHHQQALYERTSSKPVDTYDSIEHPGNIVYPSSNYAINFPIERDSPHNDKEPLIPKYDRRQVSHSQSQPKRINAYDPEFENTPVMKSSNVGLLGSRRHHFDDPYSSELSSHQLPISNHQSRGLSSSKYSSSPYKNTKYESRDSDSKLINSRSYWSCGSCTYNNQVNSEICEMCRNRRPSH